MNIIERVRCRVADKRGRGVYSGWPNENSAIFIHIPKTAGTSVSNALGLRARHVTAEVFQSTNPHKFANFFKFGFVRNPFDRLLSSYTFLAKGGLNEQDMNFARAYLYPYKTFQNFIEEGLAREPRIQCWVHFRPQSDFVCDNSGANALDFTGRFENLNDDFAIIARRLARECTLPLTNQSQHIDYRDAYNSEMVNIVSRIYRKDFEMFEYDFNQ